MSVGLITRQSIRKALSNEISADLVRIKFRQYFILNNFCNIGAEFSKISCTSTNA
jgi:hypothetical protein